MSELLSTIIYKKFPIGTIAIFVPCNAPQAVIDYVAGSLRGNGLGQFTIEIVKTNNSEWVGCIAAQRFNIGNWGQKASVMIKGVDFYNSFEHDFDCSAIKRFAQTLLDVTSFDRNPITIIDWRPLHISPAQSYFESAPCIESASVSDNPEDYACEYLERQIEEPTRSRERSIRHFACPSAGYANEKSDEKPTSGFFSKLKDKFSSLLTESDSSDEHERQINLAEVRREEDITIYDVERDKKMYIDRISAIVLDYVTRFNEVPPMEQIEEVLRGKLTIKSEQTSPIVVNGDLKVILPAYNELELRFSPLLRTLYILFLCHPEGIVLKQIDDLRKEIEGIYLLIKPGGSDDLMRYSIDELCDPMSDSLRQKISKINRIIKCVILNPELADHYLIKGQRGQAYSINISPSQITLPQCFK